MPFHPDEPAPDFTNPRSRAGESSVVAEVRLAQPPSMYESLGPSRGTDFRFGAEPLERGIGRSLEPIGGALGGLAGGIPGATAGGMTGSALEQGLLNLAGLDKGHPLMQVAMDILHGGVNQGLNETAGLGFAKGMGAAGRGVNRYGAVRPSGALLREFPESMGVINKERFPVGTAERPATEATSRRMASGDALSRSLERADAAGLTHELSPRALPPEVQKLVDRVGSGKDADARVAAIRQAWTDAVANARGKSVGGEVVPEKARSVVAPVGRGAGSTVSRKEAARILEHHENMVAIGRKSSQPLAAAWEKAIDAADDAATAKVVEANRAKVRVTPSQTQGLKSSHQGEGATVNRAERKGTLIPPGTKIDAETDQAIGRALRRMQHSLPEEYGVAARDKRTQSLIGAEKMIAKSEERGSPRFPLSLGAPGAIANVLLEPLGRPENLSRVARGLMHPATAAVAGQVPRAASAATGMDPLDFLRSLVLRPQAPR